MNRDAINRSWRKETSCVQFRFSPEKETLTVMKTFWLEALNKKSSNGVLSFCNLEPEPIHCMIGDDTTRL